MIVKACIDCGRPAKEGSSWCVGCDSPIHVSARDYADAMRSDMEGEK